MIPSERKRLEAQLKRAGFSSKEYHAYVTFDHIQADLSDKDWEYLGDVREYYSSRGFSAISPLTHILCLQNLNLRDPRIIPDSLRFPVINAFNDIEMMSAYTDKNLYPLMVHTDLQPRCLIHRVGGEYFCSDYRPLKGDPTRLLDEGVPYIIKPAKGANGNGVDVLLMEESRLYLGSREVSWVDLIKKYGEDFLVQEKVKQHDMLNKINPRSLNTLRLVTLRWEGEIRYLLGFLRVGVSASITDNASCGGLCVGLDGAGAMNSFAVNKSGRVFCSHPTTGYSLHNNSIPNFSGLKEFVRGLHRGVPHHDLVSWDVAIDVNGDPVFIENNFAGAFWIYQMSSFRCLFGELSESVLEFLNDHPYRGGCTAKKPLSEKEAAQIILRNMKRKVARKLRSIYS